MCQLLHANLKSRASNGMSNMALKIEQNINSKYLKKANKNEKSLNRVQFYFKYIIRPRMTKSLKRFYIGREAANNPFRAWRVFRSPIWGLSPLGT